MKNKIIFYLCFILILSPPISLAAVNLPWHDTYNCSEWKQTDGNSNCDGLAHYGDWATTSGREEQITSVADYQGGVGEREQRHWLGDSVANNSAVAQALLAEVQPHLGFDQGEEVTMFVMDMPPDVPLQYAPVVIAQASKAQKSNAKTDRTIGVCHLIENKPESRLSAINAMGPAQSAWGYLKYREHRTFDETALQTAKMTLLQAPEHGTMEDVGHQSYYYYPADPNYFGPDRATVLVEVGGYKVKVLYFFELMQNVPGSSDQGTPYDDKRLCPNGRRWRISFDENDPNAPIYTFQHPYQLTSALAGVVQANLTFIDLSGDAVANYPGGGGGKGQRHWLGDSAANNNAAAQALFAEVQPHLNFDQGDVTMFVMDMPPDVPPQYAPVVIAQASQAQLQTQTGSANVDRTIGVCHLIQNPPIPPGTAVNVLSPLRAAQEYVNTFEKQYPKLTGTTALLQGPAHGELKVTPSGNYRYYPTPDYYGPDQATFLVEIGGYKVKVMYFFNVLPGVPGGTDEGDPYDDKKYCPKGPAWKISFNENDPNGNLITFQSPLPWTNYLAQTVKVNLDFADLAGDALANYLGGGGGKGQRHWLGDSAANNSVAAQSLLEQVQPHLNFEQGDITMFVMDMPDVPPQYAPVVIAQASQAQKSDVKTDRTIGVCQVLENPPHPGMSDGSAMNSMGPLLAVRNYFRIVEHRQIEASGQVSIVQNPVHGTLKVTAGGDYVYLPQTGYIGEDRVTLLVEIGSYKVNVKYFFHVEKVVDDEDVTRLCPSSYWKISFNPDDPNADLLTFQHPSQLTSALAGVVQANLTFADLAGSALGESAANTITLDTTAAGHGGAGC